MTIKAVICFATQDGLIHTTIEAAENWEKILQTTKHKEESSPEYNYRSQGEDDHIDRYFGRGL